MVDRAAPPALTKLGFRRDVRLFLSVLVSFLALLIVVLIALLQTFAYDYEEATMERWNAIADAGAHEIGSARNLDDAMLRANLLLARYDLARVTVQIDGVTRDTTSDRKPRESETIRRAAGNGNVTFVFDATTSRSRERLFRYSAAICFAAAVCGIVLLLFYLPRITRPIELLLDQAKTIGDREAGVGDEAYLIETFRNTIDTMKRQEIELHRLHDLQKSRADDLERVTAALTRSLSSGLIAADADGRIVDINAAAREILHLDRNADFAGRSIEEALGPTPFTDTLVRAIAERTALARHEVNDETLVIGVTTVPLLSPDNTFLGLLALFTDLTPIRKLESRVRDMEKLADIGEISAGVAHEFRNSLATILGYLRLAQRDVTPDEIRARVQRAEKEATSLGGVIDSLLTFARPMSIDAQRVELASLCRDVVARLDQVAGDVKISVRGEGEANADATLLSRAVENLVRNAIDAVRDRNGEGRVAIDITNDPPAITVTDNGGGVDADLADRLFVPFQSRKANGLGLGLPLARKIVLLHGGEIRVGNAPGEGARVTIELPPA
jgi:signal transduction histidine kinase